MICCETFGCPDLLILLRILSYDIVNIHWFCDHILYFHYLTIQEICRPCDLVGTERLEGAEALVEVLRLFLCFFLHSFINIFYKRIQTILKLLINLFINFLEHIRVHLLKYYLILMSFHILCEVSFAHRMFDEAARENRRRSLRRDELFILLGIYALLRTLEVII